MIKAQTLPDVIAHLDNIIDWSIHHNSRIGYFASLYRQMTLAVKNEIGNKRFVDGGRMEDLDVNFANRYLQAWEAYTTGQKCSNAWCAAFDACNNSSLVVLQHLILGINTHINLDLGIAAAQTCPGEKIYALQSDFESINNIIASLSQQVQDKLANIWFPLRILKKISNKKEEAVLNFSINTARKTSWANGVALAMVQGAAQSDYINLMDNTVESVANRIMKPGFFVGLLLRPVNWMESKDVSKIIKILNE
ncbi:MAG: DUF5995 family protein [Chitinophagaceae bacterium]|nr:DUF5995 family protein [Chitinophagaceae bacterium]